MAYYVMITQQTVEKHGNSGESSVVMAYYVMITQQTVEKHGNSGESSVVMTTYVMSMQQTVEKQCCVGTLGTILNQLYPMICQASFKACRMYDTANRISCFPHTTVECYYNTVKFFTILYTALHWQQQQDVNQTLTSQQTPHTSTSRVRRRKLTAL